MQNTDRLRILLMPIQAITEKYEEIDRASGRNFNCFRIIRKGHEEVGLHSAFLAELLNPKGKHDSGPQFLKLFTDMLEQQFPTPHKITVGDDWHADSETSLENVSGRVDIIVENSDTAIIIENKIWAGDQDNQLCRYSAYKKNKKKLYLIYLTLDGRDPSPTSIKPLDGKIIRQEDSKGDNGYDITNMSYAEHILGWLDACVASSTRKSYIRENLLQYQDLINSLVGKGRDKEMNMEIQKQLFDTISKEPELIDDIETAHQHVVSDEMLIKALTNVLGDFGFRDVSAMMKCIWFEREIPEDGVRFSIAVPREADVHGNICAYFHSYVPNMSGKTKDRYRNLMHNMHKMCDGSGYHTTPEPKIAGCCPLFKRTEGLKACFNGKLKKMIEDTQLPLLTTPQ